MANSMANLLVKFETLDGQTHENVTLAQFLDATFDVTQLSEEDQIKREAIGIIYKLNGNESKLFDRFPNREHPLLFDFIVERDRPGSNGHYDPKTHAINLRNPSADEGYPPLTRQQKVAFLVGCYAHEMKHCQQFDKNIQAMYAQILTGHAPNGWATHQLRYLSEAQAHAFGGYVYQKAFGNTNFLKDGNEENYEANQDQYASIIALHQKLGTKADYKDVEKELIMGWLDILYEGTAKGYRDSYHRSTIVKQSDAGINEIPPEFRLKKDDISPIMDKLKNAPKTPTKRGLLKAQTKLLTTLTNILHSKKTPLRAPSRINN